MFSLLEWANSQTGSIEFLPDTLSVNHAIEQNIKLLKPQAENKKLRIFYDETQWLNVFADKRMLNMILRNLISNAIKFSEQGEIKIEARQQSAMCEISIADQGVGISEDRLDLLFSPTAKEISTEGTSGELGTGLGLLLCKDFVLRHGGKIWVESEVNKGSTFIFSLPLKQE